MFNTNAATEIKLFTCIYMIEINDRTSLLNLCTSILVLNLVFKFRNKELNKHVNDNNEIMGLNNMHGYRLRIMRVFLLPSYVS